jgi:hypothetical protein
VVPASTFGNAITGRREVGGGKRENGELVAIISEQHLLPLPPSLLPLG